MTKNDWLLIGFAGAVAFYLWRQKQLESESLQFTELDSSMPGVVSNVIELFQPELMTTDPIALKNRLAFLATIRAAEGTDKVDDPYTTGYGYADLSGYGLDTHPAMNGWPGVKLPDPYCKAAALSPGCVSTAAGAYQITKPTYLRLMARLKTTDFSPMTQDEMALELAREKGALSEIDNGNIVAAVAHLASVWASLPGSAAGQGTRTVAFIQDAFDTAVTA